MVQVLAIINGKEVFVKYLDDGTTDILYMKYCQENFTPHTKAAELLYNADGSSEFNSALRKIRRSLNIGLRSFLGKPFDQEMQKQIVEKVEQVVESIDKKPK